MLSVRAWSIPGAACAVLAVVAATTPAAAQNGPMYLASPEFANGSFLPLNMINNITGTTATGSTGNVCTANGAPGGNTSPPLYWGNVPYGTRSLALVLYDVTAAFTHWGIYNISPNAYGLPANAGAPGASPFGTQIEDDGGVMGYYGPCPPFDYPPNVHVYVFTLYALDRQLTLAGTANFPADAETFYQSLIPAPGFSSHVLATATLTGFFSSTPH